jgi:predicted small lipoprotein YifL
VPRPRALAAVLCLAACGRGHLLVPDALVVQVVDERDERVTGADVELRRTEPDGEHVIAHARTDGDGVAVFAWPGEGMYRLDATTDLTCCIRQGSTHAVLHEPGELVILETATGPCPVFVPESC